MFAEVRAEIIAEFFAKEQNAAHLFPVARELEGRAHARSREGLIGLSVEAKSIIGVFADFVGAKRTALLSSEFVTTDGEHERDLFYRWLLTRADRWERRARLVKRQGAASLTRHFLSLKIAEEEEEMRGG